MKKTHIIHILNLAALLSLGYAGNSFTASYNRYVGLPQKELDDQLRTATRYLGMSHFTPKEKLVMLKNAEKLLSEGADPSYRGEGGQFSNKLDALHNLRGALISLYEQRYEQDNPLLEPVIIQAKNLHEQMLIAYYNHFPKQEAQEQKPPTVYRPYRLREAALPSSAQADDSNDED